MNVTGTLTLLMRSTMGTRAWAPGASMCAIDSQSPITPRPQTSRLQWRDSLMQNSPLPFMTLVFQMYECRSLTSSSA